MEEAAQTPDITYQPQTQSFTFSTIKPKRKSYFKKVLVLILGIILFFIVVIGLLVVLNYFSIISLRPINPTVSGWPLYTQKNDSPQIKKITSKVDNNPYYLQESKVWRADGIFYNYMNNRLDVNVGKSNLQLEYSTENIYIYKSTNGVLTLISISDLEKKENLGKKITVIYIRNENGKNIIQTITLD